MWKIVLIQKYTLLLLINGYSYEKDQKEWRK